MVELSEEVNLQSKTADSKVSAIQVSNAILVLIDSILHLLKYVCHYTIKLK